MRAFRPEAQTAASASLVVTPSYLSTTQSSPLPVTQLTPSNDNTSIPVWALVGDSVKAVAATAALQLSGKPARAFVFNLTPLAIDKAQAHPAGFVDSLKRDLDKVMNRAGLALPYWFCIDITKEGRLHVHGAFAGNLEQHPTIRDAMKAAWGPGEPKQLWFSVGPCDDGWATYSVRNHRKVEKLIGRPDDRKVRTLTINQPLRRDAEWTYGEIRRIMKRAPSN